MELSLSSTRIDMLEDVPSSKLNSFSAKKTRWIDVYFRQFKALFTKNLILQKKQTASNICQIITPLFFLLIVYLFKINIEIVVDKAGNPIKDIPLILSKKWWLISPTSTFKVYWDYIGAVFILYVVLVLPYKFSFIKTVYTLWNMLDVVMDIFFFLDLIITFFTPIYNDVEQLITDLKKIAINYLKFWFWLDFCSILPLDYFLTNEEFSILLKFTRLPRLYKVVKITKVFRTVKTIRNQNTFWSKLYDLLRLNPGFDRLALDLFLIFIVCHIFACLWHFFADIDNGVENWIWRLNMQDSSNFERYLASLYWIIQTVITVGYGDVGAVGKTERILAILGMLAGAIFFSLTIGSLTSLISDMDAKNTAYESKLNVLLQIKQKYDITDKELLNTEFIEATRLRSIL